MVLPYLENKEAEYGYRYLHMNGESEYAALLVAIQEAIKNV